jgi:Flp pilus assembly protein TadG
MSALLPRLHACTRGGSAAEFALVLPLLMLFIFGIIDVGRFMWEVNQAEKATQVGARMAIVTTPVSPGLVEADFASSTLAAGALIPASALGKVVCTSTDCKCTAPCPTGLGATTGVNSTAFNAIVARMAVIKPGVTASNVEISYSGSGFGYAGTAPASSGGGSSVAETMEISPLVTVALTGVEFKPITALMFATISLPSFTTTMTAEDSAGTYSN